MMTERVRLPAYSILIFLVGGLLLSFSRGAWAHFAISAAVAVILLIVTAPEPRVRGRILLFSIGALIGMALLFSALISIPSTTCSSSARRRSSPTTSVPADGSGSKSSRSASSSITRTD